MRRIGTTPRSRLRRVVPACLAGTAVLVVAACAAPPDLPALDASNSATHAATASEPPTGDTATSDQTRDANPASTGSNAADPTGANPTGANPTGAESTGDTGRTDPARGADPTGDASGSSDSGDTGGAAGRFYPAADHPGRDITVGENVDLSAQEGFPKIAVTVAGVTRNASCPLGPPPRLGQYVALDLIVRRTDPDHDNVGLTGFEWGALNSGGTATTTHGLSGFLCQRANEQFPLRFAGRDEVRGQLILDVPADTVTVTATIPWDQRAARLLIPVGAAR